MTDRFACYMVRKAADGEVHAGIERISSADLPAGDVLIRVAYSSLNYKDALAATGHPGVVRKFPHVPGVDLAGTVASSAVSRFRPGDQVLITGYDLGAGTWGGYSAFVRVPAEWIVPLPAGLTLGESMIYGTAGLTAAQAATALATRGVKPDTGTVVVTGASGGVGSLAVALLAKQGYKVAAVTGKDSAREYLERLGAARILTRERVTDSSDRPLLPGRWAGAIDTVGGRVLSTLVRSLHPGGCVAACGLVGGTDVPMTVYPFILRGVDLVGIDSVHCPMDDRLRLWNLLAGDWKIDRLTALAESIGFDQLDARIAAILAGGITGRVVVQPTVAPD